MELKVYTNPYSRGLDSRKQQNNFTSPSKCKTTQTITPVFANHPITGATITGDSTCMIPKQ